MCIHIYIYIYISYVMYYIKCSPWSTPADKHNYFCSRISHMVVSTHLAEAGNCRLLTLAANLRLGC